MAAAAPDEPRSSSYPNKPATTTSSNITIVCCLFVISSACKVLLFPAYRSTDFDVHRHWKAVTRHVPRHQWYDDYDSDDDKVNNTILPITRHTVDYPPAFLWLEAAWAHNPVTQALLDRKLLDDDCLALLDDVEGERLQPAVSAACIAFMRSTVVVGDVILWLGAYFYVVSASSSSHHNNNNIPRNNHFAWPTFLAVVMHPALLWLDHVHFQYNGLIIGVWLASLTCLLRANANYYYTTRRRRRNDEDWRFHAYTLGGASLFALVLSLKHLYLTLSPWYAVYLLRSYCFVQTKQENNNNNNTSSVLQFRWRRLVSLAAVTVTTLLLPAAPLWYASTDRMAWWRQVMSRLFPFERGLVHDYWAANVWAFVAAADKVYRLLSLGDKSSLLSLIQPAHTAIGLAVAQVFGAYHHAWRAAAANHTPRRLLLSLAHCAAMAFSLAYHVHEKAILNTLVPLTLLLVPAFGNNSQQQYCYAALWWECTAWGTLGLVPLLYEPREFLLKGTSLAAYLAAFDFWYFRHHPTTTTTTTTTTTAVDKDVPRGATRTTWPAAVMMVLVWIQVDVLPLRWFGRWEFVPLALTSLVCATGLLISFVRLTHCLMILQD